MYYGANYIFSSSEKLGPGTYRPSPQVEFGKFKRDATALLAPRSPGTIPRAVIDKKTLQIRKRKPKASKSVEESAHLGKALARSMMLRYM